MLYFPHIVRPTFSWPTQHTVQEHLYPKCLSVDIKVKALQTKNLQRNPQTTARQRTSECYEQLLVNFFLQIYSTLSNGVFWV